MSRFSPNSLLDAVTLPFAMVQFRSNVYVEAIAPDLRPAIFVVALVCLAMAILLRWLHQKGNGPFSVSTGLRIQAVAKQNTWIAVSILLATALTMALWIASSANGRYGLLPITLCAPAIVAAAILLLRSRRAQLALVGAALAGQVLFFTTANLDHTWTQLTPDIWREPHALAYAPGAAKAAGIELGKDVVVISPRTQTAMSAAWQLFGPEPRYVNAAYLVDTYSYATSPMQRAIDAVAHARVIYAVFATPEVAKLPGGHREATGNSVTKFSSSARVSLGDRARLQVLGAALDESKACIVMPSRMGAHLIICRLIHIAPSTATMSDLPSRPLALAKELAQACPRLFGEMLGAGSDGDGGIEMQVHDGKYSLAITKDDKIYAKPRYEWNYRLVADVKKLYSSNKTPGVPGQFEIAQRCAEFAPPGTQYFR